MRVIAGSARRMALKTIEGLDTRPTTDRIKETLFNMLQYQVPGCLFLDLFSGSGAIGIEALSRGARKAVFVENNPSAAACIRENLSVTHLADKAVVMQMDVFSALKKLQSNQGESHTLEAFDYIFMDPPYNCGWERSVLEYLTHSCLADQETTVIIEASKETSEVFITDLGWKLLRVKDYKTNKHIFTAKGDC
ncbi:MAG: 16S rRNA (guanine(966)-N(2))-methyltransferase RsmD [Lachnospiraceae bacterium]|nr:16S rRNA (guanine(966)-N(2))-methyltransferase RsmD [Lachnospiraceae bacterium]